MASTDKLVVQQCNLVQANVQMLDGQVRGCEINLLNVFVVEAYRMSLVV